MQELKICHYKSYVWTFIAVASLFYSGCIKKNAPDAPGHLQICNKVNPSGVSNNPFFGWHFHDPNDDEVQSAYQILVASSLENLTRQVADIWDSGKMLSSQQNYIYYNGDPLSPDERYYWTVRTWDRSGFSSRYSEPAYFDSGLFENEDWSGAAWIHRTSEEPENYTYFRKTFALPNDNIKRAVLHISAHHSYELYLNGKHVGKAYNHHYPAYGYYQSWNVGDFLNPGQTNCIAMWTHWYGGGQGRATAKPGLLVKGRIEMDQYGSVEIVSDSSWSQIKAAKWVTGQPQRNGEGVGMIEMIDSRLEIPGWFEANFPDSSWAKADVYGTHPTSPWNHTLQSDLTRIIEQNIAPVSIREIQSGKFVVDLGKIYSGYPRIAFSGGQPGDTVKITGGFVLNPDGSVSRELDQRTNMDYYCILDRGETTFQPAVYLGMRYLEVETPSTSVTLDDASLIFRYYELDTLNMSFQSSDTMLNRVWALMIHSLLVGSQEGFVDTPTREKGPFLSDSWSQAVPAMSALGDRILNLKYLLEFIDSQDQYWPDGRMNAVYPNADGARDIPDYTLSYLVWAWDYYRQTGNKNFLEDHYQDFAKIGDYIDIYTDQETGLVRNLEGGGGPYQYGIIDWPPQSRYGYDMDTECRTVVNLYALMDYQILSKIAGALGKSNDERSHDEKAIKLAQSINRFLKTGSGLYHDGLLSGNIASSHTSQHANMMALASGIVPEHNLRSVIQFVKDRRMSVGMVTLRWLPEAVGLSNEGEHLLELYTNPDWDGWADILSNGATVTWESWDAPDHNLSLSHPWGAAGILGIQEYIAGLKVIEPQHDIVQIKPLDFGERLKEVSATFPTDRGAISIHWQRNQNKFNMRLDIPDNISAKVYIPTSSTLQDLVSVNGQMISAESEGQYKFVGTLGSGSHVIETVP